MIDTNCIDIQDIPSLDNYPDIQDAIDHNNLVIFIGAGVSRLVGCKSWQDLAYELLKKCLDNHLLNYHEFDVINSYTDQKKKISIAYELLNEKDFFTIFDKSLETNISNDKKNIYDCINLLGDYFVTTNADDCFDSKFIENDIVYDFKTTDTIKPYKLYHIHGSKNDRSSLVFTAKQYLNRYNNFDNDNKPLKFKEFLNDLFSNHTVLFMGYGLAEFELLDYLTLKSNINKSNKCHYALMPYYSFENKIAAHDQLYYKSLNIKIIPYQKDINGYEQLIEIANDWGNKSEYLKKIDTELDSIFNKKNLSDTDLTRILEIISRDDSFLNCFLKLCNRRPEFTPQIIKPLYENKFFNPSKNCDYWRILDFLKTFSTYSNKSNSEVGMDVLEKILLENIKPTDKRIESNRSDTIFLEIIFSLDEKFIKDDYIEFIENVFTSKDASLASPTFVFLGIPKILKYKNKDYIKRIIKVLFSIKLDEDKYPYISPCVDSYILMESAIKNIDEIFAVLGDDLLRIIIDICSTIPPKYYWFIRLENYKTLVFEDDYLQSLFNLAIYLLKRSSNRKQILSSLKKIYGELITKFETALNQPEKIFVDTFSEVAGYNIPTQSEDEIKSMKIDDVIEVINNCTDLDPIEKSQTNMCVQDWIEKYAELDIETLNKFQETEPYFLNSVISALRSILGENKEDRIKKINDILVFFKMIINRLLEYQKTENDKKQDSNYALRNICSFISEYISKFLQSIEYDTFLKMKKIILIVYKNLTDRQLIDNTSYSYNSDFLNSISGCCFDSLFYLYAYTKENLKQEDIEIQDIFSSELNRQTSSNFLTMFGKYYPYFFYHDRKWAAGILLEIIKKDNSNIQKSFWAGYFYTQYGISKESYNFMKNNGVFDNLLSLNLDDSEFYQKIANICAEMYLENEDDLSKDGSFLESLIKKNNFNFLYSFINSFLIRKNILGTKYEKQIISIWKKIIESIRNGNLQTNPKFEVILVKLLQLIELVSKIDDTVYNLISFSTIKLPKYRIDLFFVPKLLEIYKTNPSSKEFIEKIIINFGKEGTLFSEYNNYFPDLFKLIFSNNESVALEIANIYMKHNEDMYMKLYKSLKNNEIYTEKE